MEEGLKVSFLGDLDPLRVAFKKAVDGVRNTAQTINKTISSIGQGVKVPTIKVGVDVDKIIPPQLPEVKPLNLPVNLLPPKTLPPIKAPTLQVQSVILPPKLPPIDARKIRFESVILPPKMPSLDASKLKIESVVLPPKLPKIDVPKLEMVLDNRKPLKSIRQLEDQLKRFKGALKDATDPASIARLGRAIDATNARLQAMNGGAIVRTMDGVKRGTNQAGAAMTDFSRIIQDMPYGFMAISNNLNPMLESFQRLKVETGSTKAAFSALAGTLSGPVGIGLGIAVVSSLLVSFGSKLFEAGQKVSKFKGEAEGMIKALEDSKESFDNLSAAVEFLNQLGSINIKINGLGDLQDLREQNTANMQLTVDAEIREKDLQKAFSEAAAKLEGNKIEKRNLFGELVSTEYDPDLKAAFDRAEKELKDHQYEMTRINNTGRLLTRKIELQKIEDAKDAAEKEKALNEKRLEAWKKYLEGVKQVQEMLRTAYAKIAMGDVDMGDVPEVKPPKDLLKQFNEGLKQQYDQQQAQDLPVPGFDMQLFEAEKKELLSEYKKLFSTLGKSLPKQIDMGGGFMMDIKLLNPEQLKEQLGTLFANIKAETEQAAQAISSVLTPAFQGMFNAITQGEQPIKAFFEGIKQSIISLINQLIAAAVQAMVLSALTGGGTSFSKAFGQIMGVKKFAAGGIIKGPTLGLMGEYAGARNNPEVVAPLNKLRSMMGSYGGGNVTVTGRLRGGDIILSNQRTQRKQKGKR